MMVHGSRSTDEKKRLTMRKTTENSIHALFQGSNINLGNTRVNGDTLYLFGNPIVQIRDGDVWITTAGWNTVTTKDRLNGLPGVRVYTQKGQLHLNGFPWDGEWTKVDTDLI